MFTVLAIRRSGGRRYITGAFIVYVGVAIGLIVVLSLGVFGRMVMDDTLPAKDLYAAQVKMALWILELLLWWSLIIVALGIGYLRPPSSSRKDNDAA